jgi:hypothetical protein
MCNFEEKRAKWRALVVVTVTLAYPLAQTGFELGAYGDLAFEHKLVAWTAVTATMIVFAIMPKDVLPIPRWHIWVFAIPSLWFVSRLALGMSSSVALLHPILFSAGIISFIICFPYAIYLIVRIANPDLSDVRGLRDWSIVAAITGAIFLLSFMIGSWSEYFVTCQDARINSAKLPKHCLRDNGWKQ